MRCWCIALYGLFQVAIMLFLSDNVNAQISGSYPVVVTQLNLACTPAAAGILQHIFGKTDFTCSVSSDETGTMILQVNFGDSISATSTDGESLQLRVNNVFLWLTGGHILTDPDENNYQVLTQVLIRLYKYRTNSYGNIEGYGSPYYIVLWYPVQMQYTDGVVPKVQDLSLARNSYSLPCYLSNNNGYVLYPFNSAVYNVDISKLFDQNNGSSINNFGRVLVGRNIWWPDPSVIQQYQFLVAHSVYDYRTRGYYIAENQLVSGVKGCASPDKLKWPLNNYIDSNLSIGGALEQEGLPLRGGLLDYDNGGQMDLSEWIVNKNRNDPSDDDKNQTDPEVNPPNTDWPEGQSVVDIGRDSFNRYENYWQVETGYYEPLQVSSNLGTLESEALTPFEKEDLELDDMPDVESKTQGLESQITEEIKKWQIYNDLQSLIQPFQATEPFKYEFEVSYEIPSLLNTGGVSPAQPSASATASASHSWAADTPKTIELGKFTLDFSIFTQNSTVNQYVTTIRTILHFVMAVTVFIKIITMVKDAIIGGARGGVMGAAVLG